MLKMIAVISVATLLTCEFVDAVTNEKNFNAFEVLFKGSAIFFFLEMANAFMTA